MQFAMELLVMKFALRIEVEEELRYSMIDLKHLVIVHSLIMIDAVTFFTFQDWGYRFGIE